MNYTFNDFYQNKVTLSFEKEPFSTAPKHVWIICRFGDQWLLTKHPGRGMEFPGGKVEHGETAKEAAIREVLEETGGIVDSIEYIAQYHVAGKRKTIIKNVYFATIHSLEAQQTYYETLGPILLDNIPQNVKKQTRFSFMMRDNVLHHCLHYVKTNYLKEKNRNN